MGVIRHGGLKLTDCVERTKTKLVRYAQPNPPSSGDTVSEINRSWVRFGQMCLLHLSLVEQRSLAVHMLGPKWPKQPDFFEETLRLSASQNWQERAEKLPADLVLLKTNE